MDVLLQAVDNVPDHIFAIWVMWAFIALCPCDL